MLPRRGTVHLREIDLRFAPGLPPGWRDNTGPIKRTFRDVGTQPDPRESQPSHLSKDSRTNLWLLVLEILLEVVEGRGHCKEMGIPVCERESVDMEVSLRTLVYLVIYDSG